MDALADNACRKQRGCHAVRPVARYAATGADQQRFAAIRIGLRLHCENILRRQSLLRIQLRNDRANLIVKLNFQETGAAGCTPHLVLFAAGVRRQEACLKTGSREQTIAVRLAGIDSAICSKP